MAYKALYNKYRPATFDEVAGQKAIVRTLRNSIKSGKIAHAYLFCGPRGTGKTSMARLFAKSLLCDEGPGVQCGKCVSCRAIAEGSHPDVIEIDAASNTSVDQARELISQVQYTPINGKYKIYIIDEVHMLSNSAVNALLKTLEEPPDYVIFILATTEPEKLLPTIVSRCQRYNFGKIERKDIVNRLNYVLDAENLSAEKSAVEDIAALSDGGMRDALSILDQAIAYCENPLTEQGVRELFGLASKKEALELLISTAEGNVADVLEKLSSFEDQGIDVTRLTSSLLEMLKDDLIYLRTGEERLLTSLSDQEPIIVSSIIKAEKANAMIDVLLKAQVDYKSVANVRNYFELTLLKLANLGMPSIDLPKPEVAKPKAEIKPSEPTRIEKPLEQPKPEPKPEPKPVPKEEDEPKEQIGPYQGSTVPSFFLEDDDEDMPKTPQKAEIKKANPPETPKNEEIKPEPPARPALDPGKIKNASLVAEGESYKLDDDSVIGLMVQGAKYSAERKELNAKWPAFADMKLDPKIGDAAALLSQASTVVLGEKALIMSFNTTRLRNRANIKANQKVLSNLVGQLLGREVFVYFFDRIDHNHFLGMYRNLRQVNKLPSVEEVNIHLPEDK